MCRLVCRLVCRCALDGMANEEAAPAHMHQFVSSWGKGRRFGVIASYVGRRGPSPAHALRNG